MFASTRENLSNDITSHKESSHPIQFRPYTAVHCTLFDDVTRDYKANNYVLHVYCRCLQILYQIAINCKI